MADFSLQPRPVPANLPQGEILLVDDPLEDEHWQFVVNHPRFEEDLQALRDEKEHVFPDVDSDDLEVSVLEDPSFKWPSLTHFSNKWGIPPSAVIRFSELSPTRMTNEFKQPEFVSKLRREAHGLVVTETEHELIVRIPRPLTEAKRKALDEWLGSVSRTGPREKAWRREGKSRERLSRDTVKAIPWFLRWNSGPEYPIDIWRDLTRTGGEFTPQDVGSDEFCQRIISVWERMRALSPCGVCEKRPSKKGC